MGQIIALFRHYHPIIAVYEKYALFLTIIYKVAISSEIESKMATINETITDVGDLKRELEAAKDNTVIFLDPDKTYDCTSDTTISVHASNVRVIGCEAQSAESENPKGGRAVIKGTGKLTFKGCTGLRIRGFFFRVRLVMNRCKDCKIEYSDFQYDAPGKNHVFYIEDSASNHIYNCKFHDKDNEGAFLII